MFVGFSFSESVEPDATDNKLQAPGPWPLQKLIFARCRFRNRWLVWYVILFISSADSPIHTSALLMKGLHRAGCDGRGRRHFISHDYL